MPELNRTYYDPDASDPPGIHEWLESMPREMRDALEIDRTYTPFLPGWAPSVFHKGDLDDLTPPPDNSQIGVLKIRYLP